MSCQLVKSVTFFAGTAFLGVQPAWSQTDETTEEPVVSPDWVRATWKDVNGDGWNDLWDKLYPEITTRSKTDDYDQDGISNYHEMLLGRCPVVKGPPQPKMTREQEAASRRWTEYVERLRARRMQSEVSSSQELAETAVAARILVGSEAAADQDNDFIPDLIELAVGLNPAIPDQGGQVSFSERVMESGESYLGLRFRCLPGVEHGYGYIVQESDDMMSWADVDMYTGRVGTPAAIPGTPAEWVTVRLGWPMLAYESRFMRLKVRPVWPPESIATEQVTLSSIRDHISAATLQLLPGNTLHKGIFDVYNPAGVSKWARFSWTNQLNLSAVAWDQNQRCVLISPRHVLMALHYPRGIGSAVVFHDRAGVPHARSIVDVEQLPGNADVQDALVGVLDQDVPVPFFKVLPPRSDWAAVLDGALSLYTDQEEKLLVRSVSGTSDVRIGMWPAQYTPPYHPVPTYYYEFLVGGDSSNPNFILVRGDPVLLGLHHRPTSFPFVSEPSNYAAINTIMTNLGGGYQLTPVQLDP